MKLFLARVRWCLHMAVLAVWLTPLILIYLVCEAVVELADKLPNLPRPGGWPRKSFKPGKILPKKPTA